MALAKSPSEDAVEAAERTLRATLGRGWSTISVLQWMTGTRGMRVIDALPETFEINGLNKGALQDLRVTAALLLQAAYAARRQT